MPGLSFVLFSGSYSARDYITTRRVRRKVLRRTEKQTGGRLRVRRNFGGASTPFSRPKKEIRREGFERRARGSGPSSACRQSARSLLPSLRAPRVSSLHQSRGPSKAPPSGGSGEIGREHV